MKKFYFLIGFIVVSISCSSDSSSVDVNPNLLQKVILYDGTINERHWNFNEDGLLKEVTMADGTVLVTYLYDSRNNVISITNEYNHTVTTFEYDINNFLTSSTLTYPGYTHTSTYTFNSSDNTYLNENSDVISSSYTFNYNYVYYVNNEGLLLYVYSDLNPSDYEEAYDYYERTTKQEFTNGNITKVDPMDVEELIIDNIFTYDNKVNPLKQALLPISKISFSPKHTLVNIPDYPEISPFLSSNNNVSTVLTHSVYDDEEGITPTPYNYNYTFNSIDLPTEMHFESGTSMIKYYYQGDTLP